MTEEEYKKLWTETDVGKTEEITPPVEVAQAVETVTPPIINNQTDDEVVVPPVKEEVVTPVVEKTDEVVVPPVKEEVVTTPPVAEKPLTVDDLDNFFKAKEEKVKQERILKEQEELKIAEENTKKENERLEREKFENESVFKDFKFDSKSVLTEEDNKVVTDMEKEFPEMAKYLTVIKKQMQAEYDEKVKFLEKNTKKGLTESYSNMYDKINKEYLPILQPLHEQLIQNQKQVQEQRVNMIKEEIAKQHPDYETITPEVDKWIMEQNVPMQEAIGKMLMSQDVNQIVKVFDFYKKDLGITTTAPKVNAEVKTVNPNIVSKKQALQGINSKNNTAQSNNSNDAGTYKDLWNQVKV